MNIKRPVYLNSIKRFFGTPFIKVLTGLRRSGKSVILEMLRAELIKTGVPKEKIVYVNLELYESSNLNEEAFTKDIKGRLKGSGKNYLLLDEVQLLPGWERIVNSIFAGKKTEIFITGSNSRLLSSELATLLSGRYVRFEVRTLSFTEYLQFIKKIGKRDIDEKTALWEYLHRGGFPGIHYLREMTDNLVYKTVQDIFSTVVLKDVLQRNNLRDADLLERITMFLLDNTGNMVSARSISEYFKNQKRGVSIDTVLQYISALESAYVTEKVRRYDIRGKKFLNLREKYYSGDISFIHALLGWDDRRISGVIENVIYQELRRRGYDVYVGLDGEREIDFVAIKGEEKLYIQAAYLINNNKTVIEREFGNLLKIKDQYPKYVVSLDEHWKTDIEGVRHVFLGDFLAGRYW